MDKFTDARGTITDILLTDTYSVTHVTFTQGAVRGNHYHKETKQVDIVLSGKLLCHQKSGGMVEELVLGPGDVVVHEAGKMHAYKAIEPSELESTCFGKRRGKWYETDTFRLEKPLL